MSSAETTKKPKKEESQTQEGTTDQSPVHAAGQNQEEILAPAADRSPGQQEEKDKDSQKNPKEEIRKIVQILLNYIPLTEPNDLYETSKEFNKNFIRKITNILKIADIPENTINKNIDKTSSLYNVLLEHQHHRYEARKKIPQSITNIVQNGKIKVINADKNLGPTVVNTLAYHKKVLSILNNPQNHTLVTMTTE
ncbi:hypothetical protein BB561_006762 [Smittium simulii]|uniref:Uncharacterized protein n=1 Tax=Smittium simulii TaxID=133385 RepID=A0A2T9Y1S0_9FUNG|nr:hypothetical protein BB561_006762 [Smittium simulii]